jgi:uncharacterized protein (TIGR00369 family)
VDDLERVERALQTMFPSFLGMKLLEATRERVRAELVVTPDLCTTGRTLHGGAVMTLADFLGASGTVLNLPAGTGTTTIESKTNFLGSARVGETVTATCEPLHRGRSTQVWRTTVAREDGRVVAVVTQTQMVLEGPKSPEQAAAELFAGKTPAEQKAILARLERAGAGLYRTFAAAEPDGKRRQELLRAAEREEENARTLEEPA